jgi:hypothetical protein
MQGLPRQFVRLEISRVRPKRASRMSGIIEVSVPYYMALAIALTSQLSPHPPSDLCFETRKSHALLTALLFSYVSPASESDSKANIVA